MPDISWIGSLARAVPSATHPSVQRRASRCEPMCGHNMDRRNFGLVRSKNRYCLAITAFLSFAFISYLARLKNTHGVNYQVEDCYSSNIIHTRARARTHTHTQTHTKHTYVEKYRILAIIIHTIVYHNYS